MKLALFTPGAYVWPVHRSFEAFLASLAAPAVDADAIEQSAAYPARTPSDGSLMAERQHLAKRLSDLHAELYKALLTPAERYARETASFNERFLADLHSTPPAALLDAFMFYFTRRTSAELPVGRGLAVLRAVFFNHEAAEPELWLNSALARLAAERAPWPSRPLRFDAPTTARVHNLAFALQADRHRPVTGAGWIIGEIRRQGDGRCTVQAEYGLDPSLRGEIPPAAVIERLEEEVQRSVGAVFGWQREVAA